MRLGLHEAVGRVTAAPVWATRSSPSFDASAMDGIAVRAAQTVGASESTPVFLAPDAYVVLDTGDPMPEGFDAVVMREHVHYDDAARAELRAAVAPYQHVRSIGEDVERRRAAAADRASPAGGRRRRRGGRRRHRRARPPGAGRGGAAHGDEIRPVGTDPAPGVILDTNSLMLVAQAEAIGATAWRGEIVRDEPDAIAAAVRDAAARADLVIVVAGSSAGRDDHTAAVVERLGALAVHGVAVRPGHPVVLGTVDATPVLGAPGYPVSASLTFDIFAAPLLAALEGATPAERPRARARLARKLASPMGMDDWVRVRLGRVGSELVATPLPRGAGVLTSLVRADGLLVVPAGLEGHHAGEHVDVTLLRGVGEIDRTIVAVGSHDLVLDLAASELRAVDPGVTLASSNVGSLGGLVALRDGLCHIAGSHLLDPASGEYTLPYVDRVLGEQDIAVVRLVHREQGLIVARGNPLGLGGIDDLARPGVRYVNRQRGAGTRVLLDHELGRRDIAPDAITGYAREEHTHLAVAAAVAAGRADAGLGVMAAARAFELDFVPVTREPYDLVLAAQTLDEPRSRPSGRCSAQPAFRSAVEALGGYETQEMGRRIR